MPRGNTLQTTMTSGEQDPLLLARRDVKHYYNGLEKARNVFIFPQGGAKRRPGLRYRDELSKVMTVVDLGGVGVTVIAPEGGTAENAHDDNESTLVTGTTNIGTVDPYVLLHVDLGSDIGVKFVDVVLLKTSVAASNGAENEWLVQHSDDNAVWEDHGTAFIDIDTSGQTRRKTDTHSARYWRVAKVGGTDGSTSKPSLAEFRICTETATLSNAKLVPFEFSTTQRYMMLFTDLNMAVYKNGVWQVNVPSPYTSAQLKTVDAETEDITTINWTQNLDTLLVFHEDVAPRKFFRNGSDSEWQPSDWTFNNIPQFDFGDGAEDSFSATRGWPVSGTFFRGRLWLAGSRDRPSTIYASKAGDLEDFDIGTGANDDAIEVTADTDDVSAFYNVKASRHLSFFASSGEFYIPISGSLAVTPDNIILRRTTERGSKKGLRVFAIDGALNFVQRGGKALREFLFVDTEEAYQSNNISLLSSHLIRSPVDSGYRSSTSTDEADYLLQCNNDGTLAVFCTLRNQEVNAWTLCETEGDFLNIGVDLDTMMFVIERTINGATVRYLEEFDNDLLVDAGTDGASASQATGVDWLEAETVVLIEDGALQADQVVAAGIVTFPRAATASYQLGIEFPDVTASFDADDKDFSIGAQVYIRDMPVEPALPDGTVVGKKKRVVEANIQVKDTTGMTVNENDVSFQTYGSSLLDEAIPEFSGTKSIEGMLGWDDDGQVAVYQELTQKLTLLAIQKKVSV